VSASKNALTFVSLGVNGESDDPPKLNRLAPKFDFFVSVGLLNGLAPPKFKLTDESKEEGDAASVAGAVGAGVVGFAGSVISGNRI
jgi:hypothetical protein